MLVEYEIRDARLPDHERSELEFPVLVDGLDGPVELLPERFREELFDRDIEFLREDDGETGIDVILLRVRRA